MNCDECWQPVKRMDLTEIDLALYRKVVDGVVVKNFCSAQCSSDNHEKERVKG